MANAMNLHEVEQRGILMVEQRQSKMRKACAWLFGQIYFLANILQLAVLLTLVITITEKLRNESMV